MSHACIAAVLYAMHVSSPPQTTTSHAPCTSSRPRPQAPCEDEDTPRVLVGVSSDLRARRERLPTPFRLPGTLVVMSLIATTRSSDAGHRGWSRVVPAMRSTPMLKRRGVAALVSSLPMRRKRFLRTALTPRTEDAPVPLIWRDVLALNKGRILH